MSARTHPRQHAPDAIGGDAGARSDGGGPRAVATVPRGAATVPRTVTTGPTAVATLPPGAAAGPRPGGPRSGGLRAAGLRSGGPRAGGTGLRWWSVVLPVVGFSVLFLLMTGAGQAQAAAPPSPLSFLGWIQLALSGF
ncbi:hypothetical protein DDQ41_05480 [Streptomyces spongiicola]|uniref:Uncharacterized protein n=1 Tax=Streptomyces spongiicola TaxID=1690221 RepID=A0ABN5KJA6_9ACTN|nr:hypothetical protein [Streptomyces spongiicola]AWK08469.1 hypothetical protein DDQ41_05480 [Streptomyces spongiicola]